jgi:hypothetical protein
MTRKSSEPRIDHRAFCPFRTPDWRWAAAEQHHVRRTRLQQWEDPLIAQATCYLAAAAVRGDAAAGRRRPDLAAAHAIYRAGGAVRDMLEAWLLTGEPLDVIAEKTGVTVPTIKAFESIFFHVRDALSAIDWLMYSVVKILPGQPVTEGQTWKYLALAGGPLILDLMIADYLGRREPAYADRAELAAKGRFIVREFATGWTDSAAVRSMLEECDRLFPRIKRDPHLRLHQEVTELALGGSKSHIMPSRVQPKNNNSPRPKWPRKENGHGRPSEIRKQVVAVTARSCGCPPRSGIEAGCSC